MLKRWVFLSMIPVASLCQAEEDGFFNISDFHDDALLHIVDDEETEAPLSAAFLLNDVEVDEENLSFLNDEPDEFLGLNCKKKLKRTLSTDALFYPEVSDETSEKIYQPVFEHIPQGGRHFFGRPRVVQAKPKDEGAKHENSVQEKKKHATQSRIVQDHERGTGSR